MTPLFYVAIVLSLTAIAVTIHAVLTAEEGYEDEEGFHAVKSHEANAPSTGADQTHEDPKLPPFLSAH